jgi:integrase
MVYTYVHETDTMGRWRGKRAMKGSRPLSDQEVTLASQSFSGKDATRNKALFLLGVRTGFRVSELLSLRVGDVCQYGQVADRVTVRRKHMKKKVEGRTVPLHPEAKAMLVCWLAEAKLTNGPLFPSHRNPAKAITRVQAWRIFQEAYAANGLTGQLGTHAMRKTFANRVYEKLGHDLVKTQRALGHKNINSTVSYLSFREEEIEDAILA